MVKLVKMVLTFTILLLAYSNLIAEPKNTVSDIPENLHVYNSAGSTYVDLNDDRINGGCSGRRYHLSPTHATYDAIVSILLTAQTAKKKVTLRYDGCTAHTTPQGLIIGVYYEGAG